ncbi:hypothetical protein A1A1_02005 [Planococcus antarcticus DSM 14505]|uniref:Uncharacterized protein n=1 Tax=Planococcus antarcticus DSM 14505 TaxID=1185653 RepID=A0A1C7DDQ7_9BACL|nr:hypothetical protein BBH88_04185 [Planococcus antarcticus DSM 14505]EIM08240.1 hypothetical protein A1A1_02005 [Planococcus antarcticus DSM 14505]
MQPYFPPLWLQEQLVFLGVNPCCSKVDSALKDAFWSIRSSREQQKEKSLTFPSKDHKSFENEETTFSI